jgi:hypothetical protein
MAILSLMFTGSSSRAQSSGRLGFSARFNPGTVGTVSGEVVWVDQAYSRRGVDYCVQALLQTPAGHLTIILAPQRYMEGQGLALAPKDRVTVSGSLISVLNKPLLLVTEVEGDRIMKFREADGRPLWMGEDDWQVPLAGKICPDHP